ncbi:cell wall-binding repeat-containing protein [Agrococcus sediminis]|uniref:cell wall-binding repeat-containing protein n=1 Tax=Agrococcus sediminis TaxID=2599924 RepID=UPI0034399151
MPFRPLASIVGALALVGGLLVAPTTASAAPTADPAAAPDASVVQCLARSAIVPVAVDPETTPEVGRTAALRSLQQALLAADPDALASAQLRQDAEGDVVGIDVLEAVAGSAAALVPAVIAGLPAEAQALVSSADVAAVGTVDRSLRALCEGFDRALAAATGSGDAIVSAAIDHERAALRLGVDRLDASAIAPTAAREIDGLPTAASGDEPARAETLLETMGLADLGVPVDVVADVADEAAASRLDDRDGHGGGIGILVGGTVACSSGFGVRLDDGSPAIMSAGHCAAPDGANGQSVTHGFAASLCGGYAGNGARIGTISHNQLQWSYVDSMVVRTQFATPTMWLGAGCTGSREVAVEGIGVIAGSGSVGFSGVRHGERYATRTNEPVGCYDFGFLACAVYRSMSASPDYVCEPGDSGGPVFQHRGDGTVRAVGLITATGAPIGINRCSYTDVATALWATGASMMTRTPSTVADTSRIAGDDRYATSAEIARAGYPNGAGRVFIAGGEGFADALSAGAAAARLRAPLLLTQRDALPTTVRAELVRLRPTQIVVVGSTPSVSAAVERQLADIAPVTRLGGANRFETSAMIAQFAFPAGSTSNAFIATGRNFPDALSAGPVAALRGAPVLLVDGTSGSVHASGLAVMQRLGVRRVTVIGGEPSVSEALVDSLRATRTVERIAGANRYQTAALVNAAFGATPSRMYLASGERFPDALAASAVAGAQRVPLYLTGASCVVPEVQAEHVRLGAPPVVLLGGFPSLRGAVLEWAPCV